MVCIAMAANNIPTTRDITVEMVKLMNLEPQEAAYNRIADKSTAKNIEPTFKNSSSKL